MKGHSPDPDPMTFVCRFCGRDCEPVPQGWFRHFRARCRFLMPLAGAECHRLVGHGGDHRSPWAVAYSNELHARRYARQRAAA